MNETHTTQMPDEQRIEYHWSTIDPFDPNEPALAWILGIIEPTD